MSPRLPRCPQNSPECHQKKRQLKTSSPRVQTLYMSFATHSRCRGLIEHGLCRRLSPEWNSKDRRCVACVHVKAGYAAFVSGKNRNKSRLAGRPPAPGAVLSLLALGVRIFPCAGLSNTQVLHGRIPCNSPSRATMPNRAAWVCLCQSPRHRCS